jgi:hypothetical protein
MFVLGVLFHRMERTLVEFLYSGEATLSKLIRRKFSIKVLRSRVSDPYSFDTDPDPDPALQAEYRSGSNPYPDLIRIQGLYHQKFKKKFTAGKKILFFWIKKLLCIYLSLGLHKGRPSYKRSLQVSKETCSTSKHEIS